MLNGTTLLNSLQTNKSKSRTSKQRLNDASVTRGIRKRVLIKAAKDVIRDGGEYPAEVVRFFTATGDDSANKKNLESLYLIMEANRGFETLVNAKIETYPEDERGYPNSTPEYEKGNKGERAEIKIIKYLFDNMDNVEIIEEMFSIKSRIKLIDPSTNEIICDKESIKKSSGCFKSDIIIDFIDDTKKCNVSIKCFDGQAPALLNHTALSAKCWKTERLEKYVPALTRIINDLNDKRKKGIYKQDIPYTKMKLDDNQINAIINVTSYFTFDGTGSSESKCPANSVLVVENSCNISKTSKFTDCETHEMKLDYIKNILPFLTFSLRSKGMPTKKEQLDKCKPWIYEDIDKKGNIKLKGALHVRKGKEKLKKNKNELP